MARTGQVLENPRRRERVTVLASAADTGGRELILAVECEPTLERPPLHIHPRSEERFEVVAGTVSYVLGPGAAKRATAGDAVVIPAGSAHTWWNEGGETLKMRGTLAPAGRFDRFMETIYGLTRGGKVNAKGVPHLLQLAVVAHAHRDDWVPAALPAVVRAAVIPMLAAVGRLLGYRPWYPRYSEPERVSDDEPARRSAI